MRLSGLAAGIATLRRARDHAEHPRQLGAHRARAADALDRAADDRPLAGDGRRDRRSRASRSPTSSPRSAGSCARRARIPFAAQAAGIDVHRQRLWAFTLSGALAGFAGGLYIHLQSAINDRHLPGLHVPDAGDARRRRLAQPVGRGRRRARDQRPRSRSSPTPRPARSRGCTSAPGGAPSSSPPSWRACCSSCRAG